MFKNSIAKCGVVNVNVNGISNIGVVMYCISGFEFSAFGTSALIKKVKLAMRIFRTHIRNNIKVIVPTR